MTLKVMSMTLKGVSQGIRIMGCYGRVLHEFPEAILVMYSLINFSLINFPIMRPRNGSCADQCFWICTGITYVYC